MSVTCSGKSNKHPVFEAPITSNFERRQAVFQDVKLESRLTVKDLECLHKLFITERDNCINSISMTKDQFCDALSLFLKKGTREEYAELFDKIDSMKEGSVDWDQFASHLLLNYYEKDDRLRSTLVPHWKDFKILQSPHKDVVQRVSFFRNTNSYISISREGCMSWWGTDLKLQWSLKIGTETCKLQDLWITHFCILQNVNKLALAFTSKEIAIYDLNSKPEVSSQYRVQGLHFTPLCLDYWHNIDNTNDAILIWGDVGGFVNILSFASANISLFERPPAPADNKQDPCLNVRIKEILSGRFKNVRYSRYEAHKEKGIGEWVRKVKYSNYLECFISCATTSSNAVTVGWIEKPRIGTHSDERGVRKDIQRVSEFIVSQGVNDFDFSENLNLIATAGANNQVCLWNPYVVSKPNGILRGHMASVVQVKFITARNQLISFSKDKVLRIWDVQLQVCIQRLAGAFPKGPEAVSTFFFDDNKDRDGQIRNRLFITFSQQIAAMDMKNEITNKIVSHEKPVVAAIYNSLYSQIVSVCQAGTITMWLIDTGQKVKQFNKTHGNSEVTCLSQDQSETRLYTGSIDGMIKVWDFDGHCYHSLQCAGGQPADVSQVMILKRSVLAVGWSKYITVFRNSSFKEFLIEPGEWKGGQEHGEDILSCSFMAPNTLATGSYDGEIVIWNINSEFVSHRCLQRSQKNLKLRKPLLPSTYTKKPECLTTKRNEFILGGSTNTFPENATSVQDNTESLNITVEKSHENIEEQNEYGWAVVQLVFLQTRKSSSTNGGANLVSCGGNGWVRFWNSTEATLNAEYVAHENVGSIIMATDPNNHFIATADAEGFVKVWEIEEYAVSRSIQTIVNPPTMSAHFQPHQDQINSLEICERNEQLFIISGSSDCSVTLWTVDGNRIGVFGQEDHWKIGPYQPVNRKQTKQLDGAWYTVRDSACLHSTVQAGLIKPCAITSYHIAEKEKERARKFMPIIKTDEAELWESDHRATSEPKSYRINAWRKTILGKDYQELRMQKRERIQPSTVPKLPYLQINKKIGLSTGSYSALETKELENVLKPREEKHFCQILQNEKCIGTKLPVTAQTLVTIFDEKSLFPNYILEFEKKMKNHHSLLLSESQEHI